MCREVNLASSSSWMYIAYNLLLIDLFNPILISLFFWQKGGEDLFDLFFTLNPLLMIDKKGEKYLWFVWDICMFSLLKGEKYLSSLLKGGVIFMFMHICFVLQIGEKEFDMFYACCMFYLLTFTYMIMCLIIISICLLWCMS